MQDISSGALREQLSCVVREGVRKEEVRANVSDTHRYPRQFGSPEGWRTNV